MSRLAIVAAFLGALSATAAVAQQAEAPAPVPTPEPAQEAAPEQDGGVNAVDWIRGALANQRYDPQDRARARNYAPEFEAGTHWRSSIFDGRRSRATSGTGLRLPNFPNSGGE